MAGNIFSKRRRLEGWPLYSIGIVAAVAIHLGASVGAKKLQMPKKPVRVEMAVVRTRKPPPPPKPEPKEVPKKVRKIKPRPRPKGVTKPPPPNTDLPPPPNQAQADQKPSKPIPIVTGISMGSTVSGGVGMNVRVGNTLYGDVEKEDFVQADKVKPYVYTPVKTYEITEEPRVLKEVRAKMPLEAKRAGIQGTVVLRVQVKKDGSVRRVKLVKGVGYGLDEAAIAAMKRYRFEPARRNGVAVDYTISRFYYVFELVS